MAAYLGYAALVILASLNRTTGVFLVLFYALIMWQHRRTRTAFVWGGIYAALWVAVTAGVYLLRGPGPATTFTPANIWRMNTEYLGYSIVTVLAFAGIWFWLAVKGWRQAPAFVRTLSLAMLAYLAAVAIFGIWHEVRLLVAVMPIAIALGLARIKGHASAPE